MMKCNEAVQVRAVLLAILMSFKIMTFKKPILNHFFELPPLHSLTRKYVDNGYAALKLSSLCYI